ncbi:MAG: cytochrome C, partial [Gammaproteobacteria bacterium]
VGGGGGCVMDGFVVRAANLSSGKKTGIGNWTLEEFTARFRRFQGPAGHSMPIGAEGYNTLMPWAMYADMKDEDLEAIYRFLMASQPMQNEVVIFERLEKD